MKWLDRLLGKPTEDEATDEEALRELRRSFQRVHRRTDRLEAELLRINSELRKASRER